MIEKRAFARSATLAQWTAANPVIETGELFFISDLGELGAGAGVAFLSTPRGIPGGGGDALVASTLDAGCTNQLRAPGVTGTLVTVSGALALSYFRAPKAFTAANMAYYSTATAAGATPTLVKFGLYSVASNGDLTLIGVTASDTGIFVAANTRYARALLTPVALTPGTLYASAMLLTTAAALPTLLAPNALSPTSAALSQAPRLCGIVAAQADIGASYTAAQVSNSGSRYFAEITT